MPRVTSALRDKTDKTRVRLSAATTSLQATTARLGHRTFLYAGTGLALAGAGAAAVTGLTGTAVSATSRAHEVSRTVAAGSARHQQAAGAERGKSPSAPHARTWLAIEQIVAKDTSPRAGHGPLPAQDRLTPAGTSGPQSWLPVTPARYDNATTIVRQALDKKMGLRSAVIAVATAMQESALLNIDHGDRDSLGLFQQRPSAGWGSAHQILRPAFAADAFLDALHSYQSRDPGWAHEPLWQDAQNVQESGLPYAYAKWEAQAAHLVSSITHRII